MDGHHPSGADDALHSATDVKTFGDSDRFLVLQERDSQDGWVALTLWPVTNDYWCRMTLTERRVLRLEFEVGQMPGKGGFPFDE